MARKRSPPRDHCSHSPFKQLKGLSCPDRPRRVDSPPAAEPPAVDEEHGNEFASAMESLAVRPLPGQEAAAPQRPANDSAVPVPAEEAEVAEFLDAVERLSPHFRDQLPAADEGPRARPRRLKQLARGDLKPAGELDLHGLHREEALSRTRTFLAHAVRQQWPAVLIVTGKGLHSGEGPVLRRAVECLLENSRSLVLEWGEAPRRFGGAGALVVFLRLSGGRGTIGT